MNPFSLDKLLYSKWTAVSPAGKEKHFIVINLTDMKQQRCQIEAIMTKKRYLINWHDLQDEAIWQTGWK